MTVPSKPLGYITPDGRVWHAADVTIARTVDPAPSPPSRFELVRHRDVSGVSGTGIVAEGVQFSDGTVTLRWRGKHPSTAMWPSITEVLAVHGHGGATEVRWLDGDPL